jgi:predicted O-linked N-acetylglucosamine transferase (SPINDLY family)
MGNLDQALAMTERTIALAPPKGLEMRLASYMSLVGRTGRLDLRRHVLELVTNAIPVTLPDAAPERWFEADRNALRRFTYLFPYYGIKDRDLLKVHRALGNQIAASFPPILNKASPRLGKLRIGFISYNFGNHPIGHLLSVFFESHALSDTELYLYALHQQQPHVDVDGYGPRIHATADQFRDCRNTSDRELAQLIRADDLHVLIDLDGHLHGGRQEVLATRPARVQIHWLQSLAGCPTPYFDYTIVDRVIVPDDERDQGNGPLIRLADAFQCGEKFILPEARPSRQAEGLPEDGFVFCVFGNWLKIDPEVFDIWLNLLLEVPKSVLWFTSGPTPESIKKIRELTEAKGVDPARLVIAARTADKISHINRHRLADLFLDTFTFSAATTTMDALSAGLPVLTKRGHTAQGRLSEAHIRAVGPTDLIVETAEEYFQTALRLAHRPKELAKHRKKLNDALPHARLFDAQRLVQQFKQVYDEVWRRYAAGETPTHLDVVMG